MEVSVKENGSAVELGDPRQLFHAPGLSAYSVAPDGKRFLVDELGTGTGTAPPPLTLVTDWTAGLQK
jgi:hypothetical protein